MFPPEWNLIDSALWDLPFCTCCFFSRCKLSSRVNVPPSRPCEVACVAQTCPPWLRPGRTAVARHPGGAGARQWRRTLGPTAPSTHTMAEMIGRSGPCDSSTGRATAMGISQDTTAGRAVLGGQELPVTGGFSQVSGRVNCFTVLGEDWSSSEQPTSFELKHLQITLFNPLFQIEQTEAWKG